MVEPTSPYVGDVIYWRPLAIFFFIFLLLILYWPYTPLLIDHKWINECDFPLIFFISNRQQQQYTTNQGPSHVNLERVRILRMKCIYFFKLWLKMKIKNLFSNSLIMYLGSFNTLCLKKLSGLVFTIKINFFAVLLVKLTFLMRDEVQCQVVF